jgi:alkanesulfonate monooxygenase
MTVEVFWRLPLDGDGRSLGTEAWNRGDYSPQRKSPHPFARTGNQRDGYTYYDHLSQIVHAAELTRFDGVWLPHSPAGEDPVIVTGAFAREARRLRFVPSFLAALNSPVYAAKIANSFQRLSGGRLAWHLVTDEHQDQPAATESAWHGRNWTRHEQIARTGEFLDVARGFWNQAPFSYKGTYYEVENGGFPPALQGVVLPRIYLGGQSDEALALSARHADVHILPLEPVAQTLARIARLDALAAAAGRTLAYAIEADVVARHSTEGAWSDLRQRWEHARGRSAPIALVTDASPAQSAPAAWPWFDESITGDNLWSGFGAVRPGPAAGLVGSYSDVAARIAEYVDAGVSSFVLSANPHLEEAYLVGERVLPLVRALTADALARSA